MARVDSLICEIIATVTDKDGNPKRLDTKYFTEEDITEEKYAEQCIDEFLNEHLLEELPDNAELSLGYEHEYI